MSGLDLIGGHSQLGVKHAQTFAMLRIGHPGHRHLIFVDPGHVHDRRLDPDVWHHFAGDLGEPAGAVGDLEKPVVIE